MAHPVIYLTGAPASGKTSLARALTARFPALRLFAYSEELRNQLDQRLGSALTETQIRKESSQLVTVKDVQELDRVLVQTATIQRQIGPMLIDSHPVTKEHYGFRFTGFDLPTLQALSPDYIICLYTSPEVTKQRIEKDSMGRPYIDDFEAKMHTELQCGAAMQYGFLLGKPVYLLDSSASQDKLLTLVVEKTHLDQSPGAYATSGKD